jgi:hypothetical protein
MARTNQRSPITRSAYAIRSPLNGMRFSVHTETIPTDGTSHWQSGPDSQSEPQPVKSRLGCGVFPTSRLHSAGPGWLHESSSTATRVSPLSCFGLALS